MARFLVAWLLVAGSAFASSQSPPPIVRSERVARLLEPLEGPGNRSHALQALTHAILRDAELLNDPAVFTAVADLAADPDSSVRAEVARTSGQLWVWGRKPQKPEAIELAVTLSKDKSPDVVHNAVYFGLSTADDKTDVVIRAMLDAGAAAKEYDPINLHGRIAWGLKAVPAERLLPLFQPYWAEDKAEANPNAAWLLYRLYVQTADKEPPAPERFQPIRAKVEAAKAAREARLRLLLPDLAKELANGDSAARLTAMQRIYTTEYLIRVLDEAVLDAFAAAAADPNPRVRSEVARLSGNAWVWGKEEQHPKAIDLALKLRRDVDWNVRHYAVYFGLSTVRNKSDAVVEALLDSAIREGEPNDVQRVTWGLKSERADRLTPFFEPYFARAAEDPALAGRPLTLYRATVGRDPPNVERLGGLDAAAKNYEQAFRDLYAHLGRRYPNFALKGIDWEKVGGELLPRARAINDDAAFGLLCMELVARLQDSHALLQPGTAKPPEVRMPEWDTGFACLIDDRDRPVIFSVERGSPAEAAGVTPGTAVVSVNGKPAEELIADYMRRASRYWGYSSERVLRYEAARMFARQDERGAKVGLVLETPDGQRRDVELLATLSGRRYVPRRPVPVPGSDDAADVSAANLGGGVGYVYVRRIPANLPELLDAALTGLGQIEALVIDVRGNSGGGFDARRAVRNFAPGDAEEPQRPRFKGPVALLIDERCISAGEGWSSWFVANKRAKLFGTATAGASARKETYRLTNGLYSVVVPVKAYTGSLDRPIERRGLEPDVAVRCNARDLAHGEDTVLETARRHLIEAAAGREAD